jgi:hypothetical protein
VVLIRVLSGKNDLTNDLTKDGQMDGWTGPWWSFLIHSFCTLNSRHADTYLSRIHTPALLLPLPHSSPTPPPSSPPPLSFPQVHVCHR